MILAEADGRLRCVTQPAHAALSGQFAEHWGSDAFDRPTPAASTTFAAYDHDDGWWTYDRRPALGEDGRPLNFVEIPADAWIELYENGIDLVADIDAYAGLLVSLHGAGLRRRRYGLSPSWPVDSTFDAFVEREETRQRELAARLVEDDGDDRLSTTDRDALAELHDAGGPPETGPARLWFNFKLLQVWDALSLSFCTTTTPPGQAEIDAVPTSLGDADETLTVDARDDGYVVAPYPFDVAPLTVTVHSRRVDDRRYDSQAALTREYYRATREQHSFALRPP